MRLSWTRALLAASLGLAACIQGSPDQFLGSEDVIASRVGTEAPSPTHRLDVRFGDSVTLLGYDLEPERIEPGKTIRITWYWQCHEPLEEGHEIFTHLVDASTGRMCRGCNFDTASVGNLRRIHPPGLWKAGTYIRDTQRITIPDDLRFAEAELRVGLFRGTRRVPITAGPHDDQRRARGPRFETGFQPPPIGALTVPPLEGTVELDGRLDEAPWQSAAVTKAFVNATDGAPGRPRTVAKLLYDAQHLYLGFDCEDDHLYSTFTRRDEHLWKQDAVEVFIDPAGRGRDYFEVQVSPAGKIFDTKVHRHPQRDDAWDSGARVAVQRRGTLNDSDDRDRGWTAEVALPLGVLSETPPRPGDVWRVNLFRLDTRRNGRRGFLSWSPPLANTTHVPARFGRVTFGAPAGSASSSADGGATGLAEGGATGEAAR